MSDDKVIFLKFTNPNLTEETQTLIACKVCQNKSFSLLQDDPEQFSILRCGGCGSHLGRIGWAPEGSKQ